MLPFFTCNECPVVWILLLAVTLHPVIAFYVPGVAPAEFKAGDAIDVRAVKLSSISGQLSYDYYTVPFCNPVGSHLQYAHENFGEILRGDRIVNTVYKMNMKIENGCRRACSALKLTVEQSNKLIDRIRFDYHAHLLVDNLPAATRIKSATSDKQFLDPGYSLGYLFGSETRLNNHLVFKMQYHQYGESYRVVGFEVEARSIDWRYLTFKEDSCAPKTGSFEDIKPLELVPDAENEIMWTYSIQWQQSDVEWASRWDILLDMDNAEIHVFSIVNSIVVVVCLSGFLAVIIIRTVRRDIAKYNRDDDAEETLEETGWKLVHGDVFRPPANAKLLVSLVGSGIHIFGMSLIIIVVAMLGMLSPSSRGSLMTSGLFLYCFMGSIAGYYSGRLYKTLRGIQWKRAAFQVATLFPGTIFGIGFLLNFFIWGKHSSGAVPFSTMLALLTMWFGIDVPLVYIGFYFGYRKQPYEHPVRTNQIPRQIPEQPWYLRIFFSNIAAGVLPFGAMFIELFFIFSAIWENQFYYLFGFLFLVFLIVVISCGLISIVVTYFQLCAESYRWWWRSFFIGGSSAFYVFAYSVFYYFTKLEIIGFIPTLLYFGYSFLIAFAFWLLTGMIGFYAAYTFVQKIYGAVKID